MPNNMHAQLVKIDVAAASLGWSAAKLFDLADGGAVTAGAKPAGLPEGATPLFCTGAGAANDVGFWMTPAATP